MSAHGFIKQILLNVNSHINPIIVKVSNIHNLDRLSRQKINIKTNHPIGSTLTSINTNGKQNAWLMRKSLRKLGKTKISSIKNGNTNTKNVGYNESKPKEDYSCKCPHI